MLTLDTWHEDAGLIGSLGGQMVANTFSSFWFVGEIGQSTKYLVQNFIPVGLILVPHANKHVFSSVPHMASVRVSFTHRGDVCSPYMYHIYVYLIIYISLYLPK